MAEVTAFESPHGNTEEVVITSETPQGNADEGVTVRDPLNLLCRQVCVKDAFR